MNDAAGDAAPAPAPAAALLAAALDHAGACIVVVTGAGLRIAHVNRAFAACAGGAPPVGQRFADAFPQAAAAGIVARLRRVVETGERWVIDRHPMPVPSAPDAVWDGDAVRLPVEPGRPPSLVVVLRNAADRVRGEAELSAQRQLALDAARLGWWHVDPQTSRATFDDRFRQIFGIGSPELRLEDLPALIHPDDVAAVGAALAAALDPADPRGFVAQYRIERSGSGLRWIEAHGMATFEGVGAARRATALVGTVADVTDRLAAERRLRDSEWRLRVAAEGAELGVFEWDIANHRVQWENDRIYAIFGRTRDDGPLTDRAFFDEALHADDRDVHERRLKRALQSDGIVRLACRIRRGGDGALRWIEISGRAERADDGTPLRMVGVVADVTERKRVDAVMDATRDALRRLVDRSPFGIYVVDADFRLAQVSAGAQKAFASVRPLLGRDFADVLHVIWDEPFASRTIERFRHTLETSEPYHAPSAVERRSDTGIVEAYDWKIERIALPDGRNGVVCHFYDLSERQRYEVAIRESEERFRQLADAMPQLVWMADADGAVAYFNQHAADYAGIVRNGDGTFDWNALIHPEDLQRTLDTWRAAVASGRVYEIEYRMHMADGSYRWHLGRAHRVQTVGALQWYGTSTEVHQLKQAEEALRDADRRKDAFLAILAHELRNPLAPIRTGVQILRLSPERGVARALPMMERQVLHMGRLLDDLLDVSRITRGIVELRRERVELAQLVQAAVEASRPLLEQMRHDLVVRLPQQPVWLDADPVRIAQVLSNLLNNAAKYMDAGGTIVLEAAVGVEAVEIAVVDRGVGIPSDNLSAIFEMFFQVGSALTRSQGGLGIGLSLVKGLVALHGGSVEARSDGPGHGAEFVVRLPLPASTTKTVDNASAASQATGMKILIVDDNQDAATSLAMLLEMMGNDVRAVFSGTDALAAAAEFEPGVALVDLGMPGMDGYEVCRRIRERHGAALSLIAVTGWGQEDDRRRTRAAGFDEHLVKPIDPDALLKVIDALPGARSAG